MFETKQTDIQAERQTDRQTNQPTSQPPHYSRFCPSRRQKAGDGKKLLQVDEHRYPKEFNLAHVLGISQFMLNWVLLLAVFDKPLCTVYKQEMPLPARTKHIFSRWTIDLKKERYTYIIHTAVINRTCSPDSSMYKRT